MAGMWRSRVPLFLLIAAASFAAAPATARADDCECDSGCAPCAEAHGHGGHHAHAYGHGGYGYAGYTHGGYGYRGYASGRFRGYRRTWSGYSVLRASHPGLFAAYGDPCYVAYGRPCGYRFYRGYGYSRALIHGHRYGRWLAWPGHVRRGLCSIEDSSALPLVPYAGAAPLDAHFQGRYAEAAAAFQSDVDRDETDGDAWIGLAHASFGLQEWERAAKALRRAALLGALDPTARLDVEAAYLDRAAFDERLSALRARVRFRVFDEDARLVLGWVEAGLGEVEDAKADLGAVLRRSPDDPAAAALLGKSTPVPDVVATN